MEGGGGRHDRARALQGTRCARYSERLSFSPCPGSTLATPSQNTSHQRVTLPLLTPRIYGVLLYSLLVPTARRAPRAGPPRPFAGTGQAQRRWVLPGAILRATLPPPRHPRPAARGSSPPRLVASSLLLMYPFCAARGRGDCTCRTPCHPPHTQLLSMQLLENHVPVTILTQIFCSPSPSGIVRRRDHRYRSRGPRPRHWVARTGRALR